MESDGRVSIVKWRSGAKTNGILRFLPWSRDRPDRYWRTMISTSSPRVSTLLDRHTPAAAVDATRTSRICSPRISIRSMP